MPCSLVDRADDVPQVSPGLRVEPGRRLVQEDDLGVVYQCERDRQPLLLAARQILGVVPALRVEAHLGERLFGPLGGVGLEIEPGEEFEQLLRRQHVEERRGLELDADPGLDPARVRPDALAEDGDLAGVGLAQALDHLERGGLSGAVRPQDPEHLAALDRERDAVDGDVRPVPLREPPHLDRRSGVHAGGHDSPARWKRPQPPAGAGPASTTDVSIWRSGMLQYARRSSVLRSGETSSKPWRS